MGLTKESGVGITIIILAPIIVVVFYFAGAITDLPSVIEQVLTVIVPSMILVGAGLIYKGLKTKPKTLAKHNFNDFVEARLFFPLKVKRSERNLEHIPHKKLVLVRDSRKAYYVGEYALNLIKKKKIEWFAEDEQDLGGWCERNRYILIPDDGNEDRLLEPHFEAEIKEKKAEYHQGDKLLFKTYFRGALTYGFFNNRIVHSDCKEFRSGRGIWFIHRRKKTAYSWPTDTLSAISWIKRPNSLKGKLNGYVTKSSEWHFTIPFEAPVGEYRISMCVYNRLELPVAIREKIETIKVV